MEGLSQEAITMAGHLKLDKLTLIWDNNHITIDGDIAKTDSTNQVERFRSAGWDTMEIDGQNPDEIAAALEQAEKSHKPFLIAAKTTIGFGAPNKGGTAKAHGSPLGDEEIAEARKVLGWPYKPFVVPDGIMDDWRLAGNRSTKERIAWTERLAAADSDLRAEFQRRMRGELPLGLEGAIADYKRKLAEEKPKLATRASSQNALEVINGVAPETIGGSADLTGSNNTDTSQTQDFSAQNRLGRYMRYGIREHGMAAAMNGIALHGGLIPYGGTFLCFADYCRPSIRLAALMGIRVIFVMTHDSIGLGEDGPTHQPVEHLASLRAIPNLKVFRPADAVETAECWLLALQNADGPSVITLTRQGLPALREEAGTDNPSAHGAYTIRGDANADAVIFATGSEVQLGVEAARKLAGEKISARVVSIPSFELFNAETDNYRQGIVGSARARVGVEAGVEMGWRDLLGPNGKFVGMHGFGASGQAPELYEHFGITTDAVVEAVKAQL
jgi:transketolase